MMKTHVVRYILPSGERKTIEVTAYNVFHAEKVAMELIENKAEITSISTL
jgi:hypothetical protein